MKANTVTNGYTAAAAAALRSKGGEWTGASAGKVDVYVHSCGSRSKAVLHMSLAIAVHFGGYELARNAVLAMLTSEHTGFVGTSALPLAVGCVSPVSLLLLWSYTSTLQRHGPRYALRRSSLACSAVLFLGGLFLSQIRCRRFLAIFTPTGDADAPHVISRWTLFFLFAFQNANVQLLYNQHWSFIGSVVTPAEGALWFAPIAGIGSLSSTLAAASVSCLVKLIGLTGLLASSGIIMALGAFFSDSAYRISQQHGFEPSKHKSSSPDKTHNGSSTSGSERSSTDTTSAIKAAIDLFCRMPLLRALFLEMLLSQVLSSLINFVFMVKVKEAILDDKDRAGWTGTCYAWINGVSGMLQFFVLPLILKQLDPRWIWWFMPSVLLCFTSIQSLHTNPSLTLVGACFFAMKTMEYSLRGAATEMLFVVLDYESRFIGKEVIGLCANRFGKSGMALILFFLTTQLENGKRLDNILFASCNIVAFSWLLTSYSLSMQISSIKKG